VSKGAEFRLGRQSGADPGFVRGRDGEGRTMTRARLQRESGEERRASGGVKEVGGPS